MTTITTITEMNSIEILSGLSGMEAVDTADFRLFPNYETGMGFVLAPKADDRGYSLVTATEAMSLIIGLPTEEVKVVEV